MVNNIETYLILLYLNYYVFIRPFIEIESMIHVYSITRTESQNRKKRISMKLASFSESSELVLLIRSKIMSKIM